MTYNKNRKIDTIIFDAGGVLFQIKEFRNAIVSRVLLSMGYEKEKIDQALKSATEIDSYYCSSVDKITTWQDEKEWLVKRYAKIAELIDPENLELKDKLFLLTLDTFQYVLYDETIEVLEKLKEEYNLVILSNATATLDWAFDFLDIRKYFSTIIISAYEKCAKPDHQLFEITLNKIQKNAENCIFIDDKIENVEAAVKLGIEGFHLDRKRGQNLHHFKQALNKK